MHATWSKSGHGSWKEHVRARARESDDERCEDTTHIVYRWVCIDNVYVHRVPPCLERRPSRRAHVVRIEPVELNPCGDQRIQPIREEKQVFVF